MHPTRTMELPPAQSSSTTQAHRTAPSGAGTAQRPHAPRRRRDLSFAIGLLLPLAGLSAAQPPESLLSVPPRQWAVDCAANEILVIQHPGSYLRYRYHVVDEKGDQVRDQIETPEGSVARLILRNGNPLTPEEDAAERDRLAVQRDNPSVFARHVKNEQSNKKLGADLLHLMPDAMIWTYTPGQPPSPGNSTRHSSSDPPLVVLDFKPNPQWSPPTIPSEALTGLEGRVWIDPRSHRFVHLDGDIFQAVNMGWGVLAHVYPGGTVSLTQTRVDPPGQPAPQNDSQPQRWIVEHIVQQLTIRALMVKTVKQRLVFDTSSYQVVPAMPYQQAITLLLNTPLPSH